MSIESPRISAWLALAVLLLAWVALDAVIQPARDYVIAFLQLSEAREVVATHALFNVALLWVALALTVLILRARGQSLADIGWRRPASSLGWLLAIALAVLYVGGGLATVGNRAHLWSDWSLYRVSLGIVLGVSAGVCGEVIFRGFVISQARDAGLSVALQVLLSATLFGVALARFGWGGSPVPLDSRVVLAVTAATAVLGAAFSGVYFASARSLTPAIAAHTAIDMVLQPGVLLLVSGASHAV
jgi:hypothetical protein